MRKINDNYKIRVTPEQSKKVQEICFKKGIDWRFTENIIKLTDKPFLIINKGHLSYLDISQEEYFNKDKNKEISTELFIRTDGNCIKIETVKELNEN